MGFNVWTQSNIGTIFYQNQGKKELSAAKRACERAQLDFQARLIRHNLCHIIKTYVT